MIIPKARKQFERADKDLRRARKLYARLICDSCMKSPDLTFICAQRAIARGLYSQTTGMTSVIFSLVRHFYKLRCEYRGSTPFSWHIWLDETNHADWFKWAAKHQRRRNGKPILRIAG